MLMVGHTFIFNPAVRRMQELIDDGAVGKIRYCHSARTGLGPIRQDVNALWDLAPHDVSIILYLFDRQPLEVAASASRTSARAPRTSSSSRFGSRGTMLANIHLSWIDPYKTRRLTVIGEQQDARVRRRRRGREAASLRQGGELRGVRERGARHRVRRIQGDRPRRGHPDPEGRAERAA